MYNILKKIKKKTYGLEYGGRGKEGQGKQDKKFVSKRKRKKKQKKNEGVYFIIGMYIICHTLNKLNLFLNHG